MKTMCRLLLPIVLCVAAIAQNKSTSSTDIEMQQLSRLLAGRWSGTLPVAPGSRVAGTADEIWHLSPGGLTLVEENHMNTAKGDSYDYAAVWWNRKTQRYQGFWCAEINDEGCSGFDASVDGSRGVMTGEWEQNGHR